MSYLNLMRNRLKPKKVNAALEDGVSTTATSTSYDNTTSHLEATNVQGAIDETNTKIGNITFGTVASITALEEESIADAIDRLRDNHFDSLTPYRQITLDIDGTTGMIFHCVRWTGKNVSLWEASKPTSDTSMTTILIGMSSTTVSVRKFVTSASGVAGSSIGSDIASGTISIQGLKF